jgi:cytochrome P450
MKLSKFLFPEIAKTRWRFILHSRECANERMKLHEAGLDADKRDFFHYLLNAEDSETGSKFSKLELWGEANVLMIAGSDTTATALSATLFYLVKHPEIVAELRKELRSKFTDIEDIAMAKGPALGQCQLLQACIKEAMRLAPPVPGVLPRECVSDNVKIDGTAIPRGTVVGVPTWTIHHNPQYFPDPFTFNPYRWLSEDKSLCEQNAYAPFSIGSRACIGREMAMGELRVTIGRLVYGWNFKEIPTEGKGELWHKGFKGGEGKEPEFRLVDGFTSRKEGPVLKFERLLV